MQPREDVGQIFVFVIDQTYGGDEETWEEDRESFRLSLERQYGGAFHDANVGPGADIPAFLTAISTTTVPLWTVLLSAFFLGKPIRENLDAWVQMAKGIKRFFERPVVLARHGAAIIAIEAVFEEMGGMPKDIRLQSYRVGHIGEPEDLSQMEQDAEICESTDTLNLGDARHIFEIKADGQHFRVSVEGSNTKVFRLADPQQLP